MRGTRLLQVLGSRPGECDDEDFLWLNALLEESGDARQQRGCFSRSGTGERAESGGVTSRKVESRACKAIVPSHRSSVE